MRIERRRVTAVASAAALATGMVAVAATAEAAPSTGAAVVINEVYGGGGNSGATYRRDFIELANVSAIAVTLDGWSVQYNSTTGTGTWQKTDGGTPWT